MMNARSKYYVALLTKIFPLFAIGGLSCGEVELFDKLLKNVLTEKELEVISYLYGLRDFEICDVNRIQEEMGISESHIKQLERQAVAKLQGKKTKKILEKFAKSRAELIREVVKLNEEKESFEKKIAGLYMTIFPEELLIPLDILNLSDKLAECFRVLDAEYVSEIPKLSKEDLAEKGINGAMTSVIKTLIGAYGLPLRKKEDSWFD